jgi:DNA-binding HxlR family transcriptional regulator
MDCGTPCPRYERAMTILGKKWTCLILRCLLSEPRRFTGISGYVSGLSDRLLSQRLQELEEAGIVQRRVYAQRPVAVEYALTAKGEELRVVVESIQNWADRWDQIEIPATT